jgi:hypothetical protein
LQIEVDPGALLMCNKILARRWLGGEGFVVRVESCSEIEWVKGIPGAIVFD